MAGRVYLEESELKAQRKEMAFLTESEDEGNRLVGRVCPISHAPVPRESFPGETKSPVVSAKDLGVMAETRMEMDERSGIRKLI